VRIAIVSREVIPFFGAGIGTYAAASSRAWREAGHEVHVLSQGHRGFTERGEAELGAICHAVRPRGSGFAFARHAQGVRRELARLHARAPFDYAEFPDYWAEGYAALRGARLKGELAGAVLGVRLHTPTFECRTLNEEVEDGADIAALVRCEDAAIRAADVVISPSRSLLQIVRDRLKFAAPGFVVPYPFRLKERPATAIKSDRPTVLYFGRLERRKGVELLIEAGQRLLERGTDVAFRFIGADTQTGPRGGSMLKHLRGLIPDRRRDRFVFETRRPRPEVFSIVRGVAEGRGVCCFPSRWENFPNVCLEAMALGAPVIGSDAGGMAEIIEDGVSGLLFRAGDVRSLESTLVRVLTDGDVRRAIQRGGPERIASLCDPAAVVAQMTAAIESARRAPEFGNAREFDDVRIPRAPMGVRINSLAARLLARGRR
jgi:glycosyltransferase involved in cell wall biosynthesis